MHTCSNVYRNMAEPTPKNDRENEFWYKTALTPQGENSYRAFVPQQVLAIKNAPVENAQVEWKIDEATGDVIVRFTERDGE